MEVKISNKVETFAKNNNMYLSSFGEGVILIDYERGFGDTERLTAEVISLLKKDNTSLMVTAITPIPVGLATIVNFEKKR